MHCIIHLFYLEFCFRHQQPVKFFFFCIFWQILQLKLINYPTVETADFYTLSRWPLRRHGTTSLARRLTSVMRMMLSVGIQESRVSFKTDCSLWWVVPNRESNFGSRLNRKGNTTLSAGCCFAVKSFPVETVRNIDFCSTRNRLAIIFASSCLFPRPESSTQLWVLQTQHYV